MTFNLLEGQNLSARYNLIRRINENDTVDCWLATDIKLETRTLIKMYKLPLDENQRLTLERNIERQKELQHAFIVRSNDLGNEENHHYVTSPYIQGAKAFSHTGSFSQQWRILRQVGKALEFAHSIGFAHGHVHPGNILIDENRNTYLSDFGLAHANNDEVNNYLSPQVIAAQNPVPTDDIYSFGQLIHKAVTGQFLCPEQPNNIGQENKLSPQINLTVLAMLSNDPLERPISISKIIDTMDAFSHKQDINEQNDYAPTSTVSASSQVHKLPREQKTISSRLVMTAMGVLLMLAVLVFFILPNSTPTVDVVALQPASIKSDTAALEITEDKPLAPFAIAQLKKLADQGTKLATELLRLQLDVEDVGGQIWALAAYNETVTLGLDGDDAYRQKDYQLAFKKYEAGITKLDEILKMVDQVFQDNERLGLSALQTGDASVALEAFTIQNAIKPNDEVILANLHRAENLTEVQKLIAAGTSLELANELNAALEKMSSAYKLDRLWQPAIIAKARITKKLAQQAFNQNMSQAFAALAQHKYEPARIAFTKAQSILPESLAPQDGLEQVDIAKTKSALDKHRSAITQYQKEENWIAVRKEYEAMLAISPSIIEAQQGTLTTNKHIEIQNLLNTYINQPGLMVTDDALNAAKEALLDAYTGYRTGPKLKAQLNQLSHLISLARIPIDVNLSSDNKTDVTIYQIRSFGQFSSTNLALYPGTYTVVGKRHGYRDVRKEIILRGGELAPLIKITCVEKI